MLLEFLPFPFPSLLMHPSFLLPSLPQITSYCFLFIQLSSHVSFFYTPVSFESFSFVFAHEVMSYCVPCSIQCRVLILYLKMYLQESFETCCDCTFLHSGFKFASAMHCLGPLTQGPPSNKFQGWDFSNDP